MELTKDQVAQLARLEAITELVYQRDAAAYQEHRAKIAELEASIAKLQESLQLKPDPSALDSANMMLISKHNSWVRQTLRALNIDLAKAYADAEMQRNALIQSNGKKVAVNKLKSQT